MEFLKRLFLREDRAPPSSPSEPQVRQLERQPFEHGPELVELLQKLSRANARLALRVEDLETKLEGGFAELRGQLAAQKTEDPARPDELFDALDALDEASLSARAVQPELAEGLDRLTRRLERCTLKQAFVRLRPHGQAPDGRLFRIVGTISAEDVPEGSIARVVRAAITRPDGTPIREGEVITSRRESP